RRALFVARGNAQFETSAFADALPWRRISRFGDNDQRVARLQLRNAEVELELADKARPTDLVELCRALTVFHTLTSLRPHAQANGVEPVVVRRGDEEPHGVSWRHQRVVR